MVVDSSALLAVLFDEEHSAWAVDQMERRPGELRMSTVNLAEVLIHVADRNPGGATKSRRGSLPRASGSSLRMLTRLAWRPGPGSGSR